MSDYIAAERAAYVAALEGAGLGDVAGPLLEAARSAVRLRSSPVEDESDIPVGASKIGGRPDLPTGMAWPVRGAYPNGAERENGPNLPPYEWVERAPSGLFETLRSLVTGKRPLERRDLPVPNMPRIAEREFPLSFIAQIDLSEVPPADRKSLHLPARGRLLFFYDTLVMPFGFDQSDALGSRIILDTSPKSSLDRRAYPEEFEDEDVLKVWDFRTRPARLASEPWFSALPIDSARFQELEVTDEQLQTYEDLLIAHLPENEDGDTPLHQLGGWPDPIQGEMEIEAELMAQGIDLEGGWAHLADEGMSARATCTDWTLLLQIDTDSGTDMIWGDAGRLYVWMRRQDLEARAFDKAWVTMQC